MKKILMLALTASVLVGACKKDSSVQKPETTCSAIIKWKYDYGNAEKKIIFDGQGRIKEDNDNYTLRHSYKYFQDKIIVTRNGNDDIGNYTLDEQGRVNAQSFKTIHEYDNDGYLIKRTSSGNIRTVERTYKWQNGNLVEIREIDRSISETTSFTMTITYGNDVIEDKLVAREVYGDIYTDSWKLISAEYFGNMPKNAPILIELQYDPKDYPVPLYSDFYSYIKDSNEKIIGYKKTKDYVSDWEEMIVEYNCK